MKKKRARGITAEQKFTCMKYFDKILQHIDVRDKNHRQIDASTTFSR